VQALYVYPDGSRGVLARTASFAFETKNFVSANGSMSHALSWSRVDVGFDFFRRPALDPSRIVLVWKLTTITG
jgi:hypothetical protein